ncbi:MAG TPA: glycine cleavage system aminomethyltransferase GcvT [Chloroflexota bacterium]|nr:glycine cleavage system aminomethyltransferase GcvT [Chloroflexota bacterium]
MSEHEEGTGGLSHTPLHGLHEAAGARMAPFGGWDMPIHYGSILEEHQATRQAAGLFDLSHMGEFLMSGPGAFDLVSLLITNDPAPLDPGQGLYSPICRDDGTIIDDIIVYHLPGPPRARYLLVVNAANIGKDWAWVQAVRDEAGLRDKVWLEDQSALTALIAIQGPRAEEILIPITAEPVESLGSFEYAETTVGRIPVNIARTGYTGEDGFEIFVAPEQAITLWTLLLDRGKDAGLRPVGLGARDTLRLEARLALYGNDIDDTTTPLEAGLARWVKLDKPRFWGRDALRRQKEAGLTRKLVGLTMADRAIPRAHYLVANAEGVEIGQVTSGGYSPTLGKGIALAYLPPAQSAVGTALQVIIRGQPHPAIVVKTPFYRRTTVAKEIGS